MAYILRAEGGDKSPLSKFLGETIKDRMVEVAGAGPGDALFIVSDRKYRAEEILGQLRLHLGREHGLIRAGEFRLLWVTDFPLFEYDEDTGGFTAMHNIVSHPLESDLPLIEEGFSSSLSGSDPGHPWRRARALQYDLVINGWEIGSGGQRINSRQLQEKVLQILGIDRERADRMFGFLLRCMI